MSDPVPALKAVSRRPNFQALDGGLAPDPAESPGAKALRLQREAEGAASAQVEALLAAVNEAERLAGETADLTAVPEGIRQMCRQERPRLAALANGIEAIRGRQ